MKYKPKLLPSLERNILKFRALQMALILFYVEDLKRFVVQSIQMSDKILGTARLPHGKKLGERAWNIVVEEGILTADESEEIQNLIGYRDKIAHKIHMMTFDLSHDQYARDVLDFDGLHYDYSALARVKEISVKVSKGFQPKFAMLASLDHVLFEDQEHAYNHELKLLAKRINKQIEVRKSAIQKGA